MNEPRTEMKCRICGGFSSAQTCHACDSSPAYLAYSVAVMERQKTEGRCADLEDENAGLRAYAELLRFAASEALIAIESDPDIERGWPNTVALLREALAKNREGTRETALQALTDFHQEHAPSGQWVPETCTHPASERRIDQWGEQSCLACGGFVKQSCPTCGRTLLQSCTKSEGGSTLDQRLIEAAWHLSQSNHPVSAAAVREAHDALMSRHQVFRKEGDRIVVAPGALREWPHIAAILAGTVAGDFRDWPKVRAELLDFIRVHQCGDSQFVAGKKS